MRPEVFGINNKTDSSGSIKSSTTIAEDLRDNWNSQNCLRGIWAWLEYSAFQEDIT